jgi:protein-S-isoprenylcysteine O-methyltransferase Ste14
MEEGGRERETAGVAFPPPLAYLVGFLIAVGLELAFPPGGMPAWLRVGGAIVCLAAFVPINLGAVGRFVRTETPVNPYKPATRLVTSGPFRVTRNPMYLGLALLYAGLAFALDVIWAFPLLVVVIVLIDRLVIAREEPYLERLFGQEYLDYKQRVRRWI